MTSANPATDHLWWLASRASGLLALLLVTIAVLLGLAMGGKLLRPAKGRKALIKPRTLMRSHELASLVALVAIGIHGVTLLGDNFLHPTWSQIAVPLKIGYRPVGVGAGIVGGYALAAFGAAYYLRRFIGAKRWRTVHRLTVGAYALAVVHTLTAGTDASSAWLRLPVLASAALAMTLILVRVRGHAPSPAPVVARRKQQAWEPA